jgi:hypothetical protein
MVDKKQRDKARREYQAAKKAMRQAFMEAQAEEIQYHWTVDGEPANEATRKLREEDPEHYVRIRPALENNIDTIRMDEILVDSGLGRPMTGYTKEEKAFRKRIDEEKALIEKRGGFVQWKLDLDVPE